MQEKDSRARKIDLFSTGSAVLVSAGLYRSATYLIGFIVLMSVLILAFLIHRSTFLRLGIATVGVSTIAMFLEIERYVRLPDYSLVLALAVIGFAAVADVSALNRHKKQLNADWSMSLLRGIVFASLICAILWLTSLRILGTT